MSSPTRPLGEDLSKDPLLAALPRDPDGRPAVGGIPLQRCIGRGGMGAVYYGVHPRLRIPVAVKVLPTHLAQQDPGLANRFLSEARLAAALASDHLVRVLDVNTEAGLHYLVMEHVEGESAGARVRRLESLTEAEALEIVIATARGLATAHAKGIIHRDIKPDNILIPNNEPARAKLADLGLAKPEPGRGETMGTLPDIALGTPGYMAPEQAENARAAGPAADIFSMGATLQALLSGTPPFRGPTVIATIRETIEKPPAPLPASVTPPVRALVAKCLSKKAADRYPNGQALLDALLNLRTSMTQASRAPIYIVAGGAAVAALLIIGAVAFSGSPSEAGGAFDDYLRAAETAAVVARARDTADAWNAVADAAAKAESRAATTDQQRQARDIAQNARSRAFLAEARDADAKGDLDRAAELAARAGALPEAVSYRGTLEARKARAAADRLYASHMKAAAEARTPADAEKALRDALSVRPDDPDALAALKRLRDSAPKPKDAVEFRFKPKLGDVLTSRSQSSSVSRHPRGTTTREDRSATASTFALVNNGRLTKKRVEITTLVSEQKTERDTAAVKTVSPLQGRTLTLSSKDGKLVIEGAEDVEERFVKHLKLEEDYTWWIPRKPVAVGESWQVDATAYFDNLLVRFVATDAREGAITLTLREFRDVDGRRCAIIDERMSLKSRLMDIEGTGELIVWVERGYPLSNRAQGTVKVRVAEKEFEGTIAIEETTSVKE